MENKLEKPEKYTILYVDDEPENLSGFKFIFRRDYKIYLAQSAQEGIDIINNNPIQLVITDQRMPKVTGIEFLERIAAEHPDITRIILTGFADVEAVIQAINKGRVYRYITKPWNKDDLKVTIDNALESYKLRKENRQLISDLREVNQTLEQYTQTLEEKVKKRTEQLAQINAEIKIINANLEETVKERTINLEESNQKLAQTNRELDLFLYRSSHDLRSPLTTLLGIFEVGKMTLADPQSLELFGTAKSVVHKMDNMLGRLVMLNDINYSKNSFQEIDFLAIFTRIRTEIEDNLGIKAQRFELSIQHTHFQTNPDWLYILFKNIIENTYYFAKNQAPEIEIKIWESKNELFISVKDFGLGIEEEYLPLIFDMYFRTEASQSNGLGLYIAKKALEKLHGKIHVESKRNDYSLFCVSLPK